MTTNKQTPTMPNNILVGSEKLFRTKTPWRVNSSMLGQLSRDHRLLLFNTDNDKEFNRTKMAYLSVRLFEETQKHYNKLTFIGLEHECRVVVDLYEKKRFIFDNVVLINNTYPESMFDPIFAHSAIYNFWTKQKNNYGPIAGAEVNQYVNTKLPAHVSNRLALEVSGTLIYGAYNMDYLNQTYSPITYI